MTLQEEENQGCLDEGFHMQKQRTYCIIYQIIIVQMLQCCMFGVLGFFGIKCCDQKPEPGMSVHTGDTYINCKQCRSPHVFNLHVNNHVMLCYMR